MSIKYLEFKKGQLISVKKTVSNLENAVKSTENTSILIAYLDCFLGRREEAYYKV